MKDILKYLMEWKQQMLFTCLFTVDLNQTEFIAFKKKYIQRFVTPIREPEAHNEARQKISHKI